MKHLVEVRGVWLTCDSHQKNNFKPQPAMRLVQTVGEYEHQCLPRAQLWIEHRMAEPLVFINKRVATLCLKPERAIIITRPWLSSFPYNTTEPNFGTNKNIRII